MSGRPRATSWTLTRLVWAGLALLHAPILVAADDAGTAAVLAGVSALFVLKAIDVRWLRLGGTRREPAALLLATVLAHHGAVRPADAVAVVEPVPAVLAVAGLAEVLRRRRGVDLAGRLRALLAIVAPVAGFGHPPTLPAVTPVPAIGALHAWTSRGPPRA